MASVGPAQGDKAVQVQAMFAGIAGRYDLLNTVLSLGLDRRWRWQAARAALAAPAVRSAGTPRLLDVATGTGDLAFALARALPRASVTAVDFVEPMLERARRKGARLGAPATSITFAHGDGTDLAFADDSFDAVTIAFGLRNFADLDAGLREFRRVLRPGGRLVVLEFPPPPRGLFGALFRLYFLRVLPVLGGLVSGRASAYRYLPDSVLAFPPPEALAQRMRDAGFAGVHYQLQTGGVSALHVGEVPA